MVYTVKEWRKAKQKSESGETPVTVARRLINLFRQMSHLDDHSMEMFNQMLLSADADALTALNSIPGGNEIHEYRKFLQGKHAEKAVAGSDKEGGDAVSDSVQKVAAVEALALPAAEALSPLWLTWGGGASGGVSAANVLTETKIQSLAGDMSVCVGEVLAATEKESLERYDDYQKKIIRLLESLVVDSDVQKMQTNLSDTIEKIRQVQEQQKQDLQTRQRRNKAVVCDKVSQRAVAILRGQKLEASHMPEEVVIEEMKETSNKPTSDQVAQLLRQQQSEAPKFSVQPVTEDE